MLNAPTVTETLLNRVRVELALGWRILDTERAISGQRTDLPRFEVINPAGEVVIMTWSASNAAYHVFVKSEGITDLGEFNTSRVWDVPEEKAHVLVEKHPGLFIAQRAQATLLARAIAQNDGQPLALAKV